MYPVTVEFMKQQVVANSTQRAVLLTGEYTVVDKLTLLKSGPV